MHNTARVAVLGDGAWGTACAHAFAVANYSVTLWCHDAGVHDDILRIRENTRYLRGVTIKHDVVVATSLEAIADASYWYLAVPVVHLRSVLKRAAPWYRGAVIVSLSKGLERSPAGMPLLSTDVIEETVPEAQDIFVLSGPSYARELVVQNITGVTVAGKYHNAAYREAYMHMITQAGFGPRWSDDMRGVQWCGALKNVFAFVHGVAMGAWGSDNTTAIILTKLMVELRALTVRGGGLGESWWELCGIGDVILTAFGTQSKNRALGMLIGQGKPLAVALAALGTTPEVVNTLAALRGWADDQPTVHALSEIMAGRADVSALL